MKSKHVLLSLALALASSAPAWAAPVNVALGKSVTVTGAVGNSTFGAWPDPAPAALSSIVDGVFLAEGSHWQFGTVWWNENPGPNGASPALNNVIEIDLGGVFSISSVAIQADNNEFYDIAYRDELGVWTTIATANQVGGAGMRTRSGPLSFIATAIRIDARGGDSYYSVSEFQAIGEAVAVPEPPTAALALLAGIGLFAARRRRSA